MAKLDDDDRKWLREELARTVAKTVWEYGIAGIKSFENGQAVYGDVPAFVRLGNVDTKTATELLVPAIMAAVYGRQPLSPEQMQSAVQAAVQAAFAQGVTLTTAED